MQQVFTFDRNQPREDSGAKMPLHQQVICPLTFSVQRHLRCHVELDRKTTRCRISHCGCSSTHRVSVHKHIHTGDRRQLPVHTTLCCNLLARTAYTALIVGHTCTHTHTHTHTPVLTLTLILTLALPYLKLCVSPYTASALCLPPTATNYVTLQRSTEEAMPVVSSAQRSSVIASHGLPPVTALQRLWQINSIDNIKLLNQFVKHCQI